MGRAKLKKDPGVPKLPELKAKIRNVARASLSPAAQRNPDATMASEPTLTTLAERAAEEEARHEFQDPSSSYGQIKTKEQLRKHYLKTLHKVIDESDIIILVLDARDPEGCRSKLVEEEVRRREVEGKKLVFVLNKVDLVPKANAQSWLKYLRHTTPTLPFLSSSASQHQRTNISSTTAPALLKLLKAYKPSAGSATVGVVGYPNVGKSSLINSLKRSKVCAVAAQAGHTKELQSIQLERGLRIVDSPGVVFDDDNFDDGKGNKKGNVLLRNVVKTEDVEDPIAVVEEIVGRTPPETLQKIYKIPEYHSTIEFLTMLSLTNGRLLKGGTPDLMATARQVLNDWNHQKIPYFTEPPSVHPSLIPSTVASASRDGPTIASGAENVGQAQIVSQFSKPFQLEGLFGTADAGAFGEAPMDADGDVFFDALEGPVEDNTTGSQMEYEGPPPHNPRKRSRSPSEIGALPGDIPMESDDQPRYVRQPKRRRKNKDIPDYHAPIDDHVLERMERSNPLNRKNLKREAKKARKAHKVATLAERSAGGGMDVDRDELQFTFMA
ncbi:P-loop containing nucleoside triphosphate hydrolase protein [Macrolepiota fuliginosa MF-IS2]|uniref:P-loop containing nucleoside triphosphate hydrolase protein n=1 Tax=Macrolepiota fuliginosa MF-IS2 TaxID=1400762 RepID=A0A9P5XE30_9AGAR|nr:P-loop containing nucleoside triphosphate hydrolase protein [Macrolepiota fuliginosa MF-IS2]